MEGTTAKSYGKKALIPVAVFLGLYLGCGIVFTIQGAESPFNYMSRYVAVVAAIVIGLLFFERDRKFSEKVDEINKKLDVMTVAASNAAKQDK